METTETTKLTPTVRIEFTDSKGKNKHLKQIPGGRYVHTGNAHYILTSHKEVILHPTKKIISKVLQSIR